MRVEVVTSFSREGYFLYGQRCVESYMQHWTFPLLTYLDTPMYVEGTTPLLTRNLPGWRDTIRTLAYENKDAEKPASFLWNARRYAVKPFIWHHAAKRLGSGILVWIDADTIITAPVPDGFFVDLLGGADVAYLGRGPMHPENGCVVFRVPEALPLLAWCRKMFEQRRYAAWKDGWTDCHALRHGLAAVPVKARDLTSHAHPEWRSSVDAFALSPFAPYMIHLKGARQKREGRLLSPDELKPRPDEDEEDGNG